MNQFNPIGGTVESLKLYLTQYFNDLKGVLYEKDKLYTKEEVDAFRVKTGTIVLAPRTTPWPGWIKANGALLSRTEYADLWTEAQDSGLLVDEATWAADNWGCYSTGDSSTTFRIPLVNGEFPRFADDGQGVDVGRAVGSWQEDAFQGHRHNAKVSNDLYNVAGGVNAASSAYGTSDTPGCVEDPSADLVNGIPRTAFETRPRSVALLGLIKY